MAATSFDDCLRHLLAHEGGFSNHPSDPGGPTNFGITIAEYRRVKPDADAADVRAMSVGEAKAIYRVRYWHALRCDALPAGVDYAVFDYGVNSGVARAGKVLRRVLGLPAEASAVTDAVVAAAKLRDTEPLIVAISDERLAFLKSLKTWPVFGDGWSRRVAEVKSAALTMARTSSPATTSTKTAGGKGVAPVNTPAQRTTTGVIVASGAVAAEHARQSGANFNVVVFIVVATIAAAVIGWMIWRWRQQRAQEA